MTRRLLRAELAKLTSVRAYGVVAVLAILAVAVLATALTAAGDTSLGPAAPEPVLLPMEYVAYVAMVLCVLAVTSDFGFGTYRVTLGHVPHPGGVLAAKVVVSAGAGLAVGLVAFAAVAAATATVGGRTHLTTASGESAAGVLAVPLAAVLGVAVGALVRHTAAAVTVLLLWALGLETVLVLALPGHVGPYLPFKTVGASRLTVGEIGLWPGLAVFAGYVAAAVLAALLLSRRRDAPAG